MLIRSVKSRPTLVRCSSAVLQKLGRGLVIRSHQDGHRTYQVAAATANMRSGGMALMPAGSALRCTV